MCNACDQALTLSAPEMFWQLFMEKEFLRSMIPSEQANWIASTTAQMSADSTSDRRLTFVEANAVRYTAGYVIRKLESKYSCLKTIECLRALREKARNLVLATQYHFLNQMNGLS